MPPQPCERCGYDTRGVPVVGGMVVCPECGTPQFAARHADRRFARWTFALGAAGPNYFMLAVTLVSRFFGDVHVAACLSLYLLVPTFGLSLVMIRDLLPRRTPWWRSTLIGAGVWAGLNAPVLAAMAWVWR